MADNYYSELTFYDKEGIKWSNNSSELIGENIRRILLTKRGERVNDLSFGSDVKKYLFMPETSVDDLIQEIVNSITRCEPRVTVKSCTITAQKDETLSIDLQVVINATNEETNINVSI
jgi:phage baseplate assembly protein W